MYDEHSSQLFSMASSNQMRDSDRVNRSVFIKKKKINVADVMNRTAVLSFHRNVFGLGGKSSPAVRYSGMTGGMNTTLTQDNSRNYGNSPGMRIISPTDSNATQGQILQTPAF
jgi:hypothetical protein